MICSSVFSISAMIGGILFFAWSLLKPKKKEVEEEDYDKEFWDGHNGEY